MCLLFIYIGNWTKQVSSSQPLYKLIIAANRDIRHSIRCLPAHFWKEPHSQILAGKDLVSSNKNDSGAYLGISKYGKVGSVVRIMKEVTETYDDYRSQRIKNSQNNKISRSSLVPRFLQSWSPTTTPASSSDNDTKGALDIPPKVSGWDFCQKLCTGSEHRSQLKKIYPFHMFTVDLFPPDPSSSSENTVKATYLSNHCNPDINCKRQPKDVTPDPNSCDFFAYGNSPNYKPLSKVVQGKEEFMELITNLSCNEEGAVIASEESKVLLRKELLNFLRCQKKRLPDSVLLEYAATSRIKEKIIYRLSSRFVTDYFDQGTRTQSILLVDTENNVTFYDWYIQQRVRDPHSCKWEEVVHEFKINPS